MTPKLTLPPGLDREHPAPRPRVRQTAVATVAGWRERIMQGDNDVVVPLPHSPRAALTTQVGPAGGYAVPPEALADAVEVGLASSVMRRLAQVVRGGEGPELSFVAVYPGDSTSGLGELLAENASATAADPTFSKLTLKSYKYSSKKTLVAMELFEDAPATALASLARAHAARIARAQNKHFTTGTGASQPQGLATAAAVKVTSATAGAIVSDDLAGLLGSLDGVYFEDLEASPPAWMFSPATYGALLKIKDSAGRPILLTDSRTLFGFGYHLNPDMPTVATGNVPVLFGRFEYYKVRDRSEMRLIRTYEAVNTIEQGQWLVYSLLRSDGGLLVPDVDRPPVVALKIQ